MKLNKRPKILILMADEQRADTLGFMGNDIVRTPNLDKLAKDAVIFKNAYTPSPVCVPARQCLAAGQLPKTCHCEGWVDLEPNYMTFPRWFSRYAYKTVACGKLHQRGTMDVMQGWTQRIGYEIMQSESCIEDPIKEEFDRYRPEKQWWGEAKEIKRAGVGRSPWAVEDEYTILGAKNFIEEHFLNAYYDRQNPERPVLLKVSLNQPHYPYIVKDEKKFNYYLNRVKTFSEEKLFDHEYLQQRKVILGEDVSQREMQRAVAAYYAMVETTDDYFGEILDKLDEAGENIDDWIIVYLSDHGEQLGEHSIWEKKQFFEGSVKVPLMIRYPKDFPHRVVEENVNLCDLFATLCEISEMPWPSGLDSRSLVNLMKSKCDEWKNESISQYESNNLMIKQDDLKYIWLGDTKSEILFDLKKDPKERINKINDEAYKDEISILRKRCEELGHGSNPVNVYKNAGYSQ